VWFIEQWDEGWGAAKLRTFISILERIAGLSAPNCHLAHVPT
jgi:hypothetical protein